PPHTFSLRPSAPSRHLHSFPTRRSSDLAHRGTRSRTAHRPGPHRHCRLARTLLPLRPLSQGFFSLSPRVWALTWAASALVCSRRSEEHTSELQSRGHLVCRLLLEKKNNR